ncbi:zinc finger protein 184-like [Engraulis encrasicolus]|uniref:zinc finger protein 184-like n=1 Tax=Engraulis encrasicolus TaxID=184585 RepID=UPI002FD2870C
MAKVFHIVSDTDGERLVIKHHVNKGEEDRDHTTETHTDPTRFSEPLFTYSNEACQIVEVQILTEEICEWPIQPDPSSMSAGYVVEEGTLEAMVKTEDFGEGSGCAIPNGADYPTHQTSSSPSPSSCPSSPSSPYSPLSPPSSPSAVITAELLQEEDGGSNMNPVLVSSDIIECPADLVSQFQLKRLSVPLVDCLATIGKKGTKNTNKNGEKPQTGILGRHRNRHTRERPYHCPLCEKRFARPGDLTRHQRRHTAERNYHCHQCHKRFETAKSFRLHQLIHTGDKAYPCPQCGLRFTHPKGVKIHQTQMHKESRTSRFPVAGNITPAETLREQQYSHTEKPFQCQQSEECFSEVGALTQDQHIHSDWLYNCLQCGQHFSGVDGLTVHQCSLTEVFQEQSFSGAETPTQHQLVLADEKPHLCPLCGLRFARKRGLKIHQAQAHKWLRMSNFSEAGNIRPTEVCQTVTSRNRNIVLPRRYTS